MIRVPALLKKGDKIAIIAPAGKVDKPSLEVGLGIIKQWGLIPIIGKHVFDDYEYFSSSVDNRLSDLQWALDDEDIKAVFCARGGYGTTQYLHRVSFDKFIKKPKWVIGYSDITLLLNKIQQQNIACIHGPMPASYFRYKNQSVRNLYALLFEGKVCFTLSASKVVLKKSIDRTHTAIVTGGNLTQLCHAINTPFDIDFKNKFVLLEDVNEYPYKIERYFYQLFHSGKLSEIKGLLIGNFKLLKQVDFSFSLPSSILSLLPPTIDWLINRLPIGHGKLNYPLVLNFPLSIMCSDKKVNFKQELKNFF